MIVKSLKKKSGNINMKLPNKIGIDNSMICSDIGHKYHQ